MLWINEGQFDNMPLGCDLDNLIWDFTDNEEELSKCCWATITWNWLCSDCKEHCC
jgi:hypothetical protein